MSQLKQLPCNDRPRERLLQHGARHLANHELLALLIRTGNKQHNALAIAQQVLSSCHGRVASLFNLRPRHALKLPGIGPATFCQISAALELARRQLQEPIGMPGTQLSVIAHSKAFMRASLRAYPHEVFACLYLDNQHRASHYAELFHGSINQTTIYPREIIKQALEHNAAALIIAHNHPSGCATPSPADYNFTRELQQFLAYMHIKLLDHIVVGDLEVHSMAEHDELNAPI